MGRNLSGIEKALHYATRQGSLSLVARLRLRPAPDPTTLGAALARLQARQPALRARIIDKPQARFEFFDDPPPIPLTLEEADETAWRTSIEAQLNSSPDLSQAPPIAFHLLRPSSEAWADLTLQAHHALLDGAGLAWLLNELLAELAQEKPLAANQPPSPDAVKRFPQPYRPPLGYLPLAAYAARQLGQELTYQLKTRGLAKPAVISPARSLILTRQLDRASTEGIVRACRQRKLSLNNTLAAAQLMAVWQERYQAQPRPLRAIAFADLRRYLQPPVPPQQLGAYLSMLRLMLELEENQGLWPLAEKFQAALSLAFRRGEKYLAALAGETAMRMMLTQKSQRMAASAVSYLGPLTLPADGGPFQVEAVNGFVSNLAVGPEFTAMVLLWQGQLQFNFVYLEADMSPARASQLADHTLALLKEAAS